MIYEKADVDLPPENWSRCNVRLGPQRGGHMARNRHTAEQIINKLREAEVGLSQGQTVAQVSRGMGVSEQTFYRWRNEYGGLKIDQVKRLKQLETENTRLKRAVADLTLDNQILREAAEGNF
jgi:transposase-like protein